MIKKIMIIGAGEMQVPIIKKAKELNHYVISVDRNINAPGNQFADLTLEVDTNDNIKILVAAQKHKIDGILTTSDYPVRTIAFISQKMNLSGLNTASAEISTNKFLLRQCLTEHGIISPVYFKLTSIEDLKKQHAELKYPLIIKPVDSSASRGVKKAESLSELIEAYPEAKKHSLSGEVLLEEYLEGPEYSVESLSQNGKLFIIAITEKKTKGNLEKYFVEERHILPANLSESDQMAIIKMVRSSFKAIGLDNCAAHTELKMTKKGPIIIEVGARLGGDFITSDLIPLATGINMLKNVINISLGKKVDIHQTKNTFSGIQFINSDNYYSAKQHIKNIKQKTAYIKSELKEYQNIELKDSLDRLGYIICECNTRKELNTLLDIKK